VADLDQHVRPTLAMLEAARRLGGKRVIFLSSGGTVYGALPTGLAVESDHPKPLIIYGATKLAVETYLRVYHASEDVDCVVVRLSNPYGSGQSLERNQGLVTTFVMRALTGQPLTVWGDGSVVRDYVHISDVAEALTRIALSPPRSLGKDLPIFNVASGVGASVNEVIAIIERQLGIQLDVTRSSGRRIDLPVSVLDITRTRAAIGWRPELSLEQGIALMCREAGRDHRSSP
jgi:UDP-glucose 4-epimerase